MEIETFSRFKYAEEFASGFAKSGRFWVMGQAEDTEIEEDGEVYSHPTYFVAYQ